MPLLESINHTLTKSTWYYVAPSITNVEHFVKALPSQNQKVLVSNSLPEVAKRLLTTRIKGELFSIVSNETVPMNDESYSALQESRFLRSCCKASKESLSFLDCNTVVIKAGSKVQVHRDENGKVLGMVISQLDGTSGGSSSSDILSAFGKSKLDVQFISSNCTMKL